MPRLRVTHLVPIVSCLLMSACGGGTTIATTPRAVASATPAGVETATPSAAATATPVSATSATPIAAPPSPTATPVATPTIAPPPAGGTSTSSIYLGDMAQGAVLIYSSNATGSVSPSAIIAGSNTGITDGSGTSPIYGVTVDAAGSVYVLTQTTDSMQGTVSAESILVFPAGSTGNVAPSRTISLPTSIDGESLASAASNLYVTDDSGSGAIEVYASSASGAATPVRTFTDSGGFPNLPLKVSNDASGNTYVATYDETATAATEATQGVYVFAASASGAVAPAASISGSATGFASGVLDAAVVDQTGRIDAVLDDSANDTAADIDEFAPGASGNATPATAFTDATSQGPVDAAVDSANTLYVSEIADSTQYARVNVFAAGATTPQQTLLAYQGVLPLIAIGPYVATASSGSMQLSAISRASALSTWRRRHARRRPRGFAAGWSSRYRP